MRNCRAQASHSSTKPLDIEKITNLSERASKQRIINLYQRYSTKYSNDLEIWHEYLDYVEQEDTSVTTSQVFASALRMHPKEPEMWARAASYEFDRRTNANGARSLFQHALRFNPHCKELWLDYAQMELLFVAMLCSRPDNNERPADDIIQLEAPPNATVTALASQSQATLNTSPAMQGAVAMAIFEAAMQQFPNDDTLALAFYSRFLLFTTLIPDLQTPIDYIKLLK